MDKLNAAECALVVIDLQRGIVSIPTAPRLAADVVGNAVELARAVRAAGGLVVLVRVTPSPDGKDALHPMADVPPPGGPRPPDWAELLPDLASLGSLVITKRQWGAFYGTELDLQLRRRGIRTILLCGISTNMGVESTARDAFDHVREGPACAAGCGRRRSRFAPAITAATTSVPQTTRGFPRWVCSRKSSEYLPGPAKATARAQVTQASGISMPLAVTKNPFFQ
jgi:nicotinamidase-related amidase